MDVAAAGIRGTGLRQGRHAVRFRGHLGRLGGAAADRALRAARRRSGRGAGLRPCRAAASPRPARSSPRPAIPSPRLLLPHLPGWERAALVAQMKAEAAATPLVEVAPLRPLLAGLPARGLRLGLATNDDESSAHAHLASAGIADLFGFVAGWDSGFGGKPEAGAVARLPALVGPGARPRWRWSATAATTCRPGAPPAW